MALLLVGLVLLALLLVALLLVALVSCNCLTAEFFKKNYIESV